MTCVFIFIESNCLTKCVGNELAVINDCYIAEINEYFKPHELLGSDVYIINTKISRSVQTF